MDEAPTIEATPPPTQAPVQLRRLGYPSRTLTLFAAALALGLTVWVLPIPTSAVWGLSIAVVLAAAALFVWQTWQTLAAIEHSSTVLAALGDAQADLAVDLRSRMPLVLLTGDGLSSLFNRGAEVRSVHVGDGAIWVRVDRPQALAPMAAALRLWRDGRAPDAIVLSVVPAHNTDQDVLAQKLRMVRQGAADASRLLGATLPGYIAVYQRRTGTPAATDDSTWHGTSSPTPLPATRPFEAVIRAAESDIQHRPADPLCAARAATLAALIDWTQRMVIAVLQDRHQPTPPWSLCGAGWIDVGPSTGPGKPWEHTVERTTRVVPAALEASTGPWPLPQPIIEGLPPHAWLSPRWRALAHAITLVAAAAVVAFWCAAHNNTVLLRQIAVDLKHYNQTPTDQDAARRAALATLVADRDRLDWYTRTGIPLRLSFGMYRGATLRSALDETIAAYQPPLPPPSIVTLDSMSLFDSGRAALKAGSNQALVGALDMIRANPKKRILIAGHTDNVGNASSNLKLSIARASAVRDWLTDASGIAPTRFAIQGLGDSRPVATNDTPDGRAKNRRVEITLIPDGPM